MKIDNELLTSNYGDDVQLIALELEALLTTMPESTEEALEFAHAADSILSELRASIREAA